MRAAIYLRISRDATGERLGVDRQRQDCERLAESRGWAVVESYTDNSISASTGRRPAYQRMLADADAGRFDVIVAWHIDRLTRSLTELEHIITLSERTGVRLATVTGDIDLSNDAGRLVGRILGAVSRGEVERKIARQRAANLQRAESGRPPMRRAYGYTTTGIEPLEPEATYVRGMYERILTGSTLVGVARWLNAEKVTNTRGGRWQRNAVRGLLLNPRYKGTRVYNGEEVGVGRWEPLVSEETWQAVHHLLTDPDRKSNRAGTARKWLGSGLFLCGRCPDDDRSDMRVNYRDGGQRVYRCRRRLHLSRAAAPVDEYVRAVVAARLRRPDLADLLAHRQHDAGGPSAADLRRDAIGLRKRIESFGVELADGVLTASQVRVATRRLQARLDAAEGRLAALGQRSAVDAMLTAPDPGAAFLDADLDRQRAVVDALCEVVLLPGAGGRHDLDPGTVDIRWRTSLSANYFDLKKSGRGGA